MKIAVIGLRAFPASFVGTSGVEFYCEHILSFFTSNIETTVFTRKKYQSRVRSIKTFPHVHTVALNTLSSKVLETLVYCFIASCRAALSSQEVVWYQGVGPALFAWIPKIAGKKILLTVHSIDWNRAKWSWLEQKLFYYMTFFVFKTPDQTTTVSRKLQAEIHSLYGIKPEYTPPGLLNQLDMDLANKKIPDKKNSNKYLLFLGRIVPEKRVDWLLKAFIEIQKSHPANLKLVIAGGHGNTPEYEQYLRKKYPHPSIKWVGYQFGAKKLQLIKNCTMFVLPSELEGNSVSLLEAISLQKDCIVADSIIEPAFKKLSFVHTFGVSDFQAFKQLLQKSLLNTHNKNTLDKKILENYSWEKTAKIYKTLF